MFGSCGIELMRGILEDEMFIDQPKVNLDRNMFFSIDMK